METNNLKPNSFKSRQEVDRPEKASKAIEGQAKLKKKPMSRRLIDIFISEDIESVKEYAIFDRLIPALKENFVNLITDTLEMAILGKNSRRRSSNSSRVSYSSYYEKDRPKERYNERSRIIDPEDIIFDSRYDAELALDALTEFIDKYGEASVADYYDIAGVTSSSWTDRDYGWRDVRSAYIRRDRDGYTINLPRATDLK